MSEPAKKSKVPPRYWHVRWRRNLSMPERLKKRAENARFAAEVLAREEKE